MSECKDCKGKLCYKCEGTGKPFTVEVKIPKLQDGHCNSTCDFYEFNKVDKSSFCSHFYKWSGKSNMKPSEHCPRFEGGKE